MKAAFSPFTTQKSILFSFLMRQRFFSRCDMPFGLVTSPIASIFTFQGLSITLSLAFEGAAPLLMLQPL
jgi:hypothetical protein